MLEDGVHLGPDLPPAGAVLVAQRRVDRDPDGAAVEGLVERHRDDVLAARGRRVPGEGQGPVRGVVRAVEGGEDVAIARVLDVVVEVDVAFFDQGGGEGGKLVEEEEEEGKEEGEGEKMSVHLEGRKGKRQADRKRKI